MKRPFTEVEIRKSVSRLKNNKGTGMDDSPKLVYQQIVDSFNEMATLAISQMKLKKVC